MIKKTRRYLSYFQFAIIILSAFLLSSCSGLLGSGSSNTNSQVPVIIQGRVVTYQPSTETYIPVSGANVVINQLKYDGSLISVQGATGQTGSDGSFTIDTKITSNVYPVVIATKGSDKYMDIALPHSKSGQTISYKSVLNQRSTIETRILIESVAQSQGQYANLNGIRPMMSDSIAQVVSSDTSAISPLASAFSQRDYARLTMLSGSFIGANSLQLNNITAYQSLFSARLDSALYANYDQKDSIKSDYQDYYSNLSYAYNLSGLNNLAYLLVNNTSNQVMMSNISALSSNLQFMINRQRAMFLSQTLMADVSSQFVAAGAPSALQDSVTNANNNLKASFMNAKTDGDIRQAYRAYHNTILSVLERTYSSNVDSLNALDSDINSQSGLKAQLANSIISTSSSSTSTSTIVQAFVNYFYNIGLDLSSKLPNATAAQMSIINSVIDEINLYM